MAVVSYKANHVTNIQIWSVLEWVQTHKNGLVLLLSMENPLVEALFREKYRYQSLPLSNYDLIAGKKTGAK
jgi:hypothetical protein